MYFFYLYIGYDLSLSFVDGASNIAYASSEVMNLTTKGGCLTLDYNTYNKTGGHFKISYKMQPDPEKISLFTSCKYFFSELNIHVISDVF